MTATFHTATDRRCKTSELEQQILETLAAAGVPVVPQVKRRTWVFDAGVQGTRILIEINGDYWHSLPHAIERDKKKAAWAAEHGYTIITIAESTWRADSATELTRVLAAIEQLQTGSCATVDTVDTEGPPHSYNFGDWRDAFIATLADHGNVRAACIAARISRAGAYARRDSDPEFAAAWSEALEDFADLLEGVYARRAVEQSDRAVEFFLKAIRRDKYGEKVEHTGSTQHTIRVEYGNDDDPTLDPPPGPAAR